MLAGFIAFLAAVYAAIPHFSVERATTNATDPFSAEFIFTNHGWLPAQHVDIECIVNATLSAPAVQQLTFSGTVIRSHGADWVWHSLTRGCSIRAPRATPEKGGIDVGVGYEIPFMGFTGIRPRSSRYFSFRYDSQTGGFVFVPDTDTGR